MSLSYFMINHVMITVQYMRKKKEDAHSHKGYLCQPQQKIIAIAPASKVLIGLEADYAPNVSWLRCNLQPIGWTSPITPVCLQL